MEANLTSALLDPPSLLFPKHKAPLLKSPFLPSPSLSIISTRSPNSPPPSSDEMDAIGPGGLMIKIKVDYGSNRHEVTVPAQSTFGELKRILARETGLGPQEQMLLFQGKEKVNEECLHVAGVKDMSEVDLFENPTSILQKFKQLRSNQRVTKAMKAIDGVRVEVDKLYNRVSSLRAAVDGGTQLVKEFNVSMELLMNQLLKLDGIEAEGEAKVQRKSEVGRIQSLLDTIDELKVRNSGLFNNAVPVQTQ